MSILLHKKDCYFIIIAKKYILPFLLKIVLLKDIMFCYFSVDATNVFNYGKFVNDSPEKLANWQKKRKYSMEMSTYVCLRKLILRSIQKSGTLSLNLFLFIYWISLFVFEKVWKVISSIIMFQIYCCSLNDVFLIDMTIMIMQTIWHGESW